MLWVAFLSFAVAFGAIHLLLARFGRLALDEPNERSLHERPVPRTGGIAVLLGSSAALALGAAELWLPFAIALGLAACSFLDDMRGIPAAVRLLAHAAAAGAIVWFLLSPMHPVEIAALVLAVIWITNLYNFMDGADGVAGGMTLIGFGTYAVAAHTAGHASLALASIALAAASGAFLLHNSHPARLFLGDVGSIPLGFLAAGLGLQGWRDDVWPLWFPVLVFGPFIGDATITLLKRLVRRGRVWQAHRDHYYQRMVRMGLGHRKVAWLGYLAMLVCAGAALYGRGQPVAAQAAMFAGASALLAVAAVWVDLRWKRFIRSEEQKRA